MPLMSRIRLLWLALTMQPIAGAEEAPPAEGAAPAEGEKPAEEPAAEKGGKPEEPAKDEEKQLGPEGEKALAAFKKRAREAEKQSKELADELAKIKDANKSEQEKALDKARKEATEAATADVTSGFQKRILNAEVKARAAGKLAYPDDAPRLLDLDVAELFDEDGEVKADVIDRALDALVESRPRLKADPHDGRPAGDDDAGKGSGAGKADAEKSVEDWIGEVRRNK